METRLLRVDLTRLRWDTEVTDQGLAKKFLGGRGLAAYRLYKELRPGIDPLGEENEIIMGVGPLVGSGFIGMNRTFFVTKGPHRTFSFSHTGGNFGAALKLSGYDQVVITGRASKPVYLLIDREGVEVRDARHLWGKTVDETNQLIRREMPGAVLKIACIGPAGENLVPFASIISEGYHVSAKGGVGCVAGSKNLKAIVIRWPKERATPPLADPKGAEKLVKAMRAGLEESPMAQIWKAHGSLSLVVGHYNRGGLAAFNYQRNNYPRAAEAFHHLIFKERFREQSGNCFGCTVACHGLFRGKGEPSAKKVKLEWGSLHALGPLIGVFDYQHVCYLQQLLTQYGMDAKEIGSLLGLAMECYERGILTPTDACGLEIKWGNMEAIVPLIKDIAYRRGLGEILGTGTPRAAELLSARPFGMGAKGSGMAGVDVRSDLSWALGHAVSIRGPDCQNHFTTIARRRHVELAQRLFETEKAADPLSHEAKGRLVWWSENYKVVEDSMSACTFIIYTCMEPTMPPAALLADYYSVVTGHEIDGLGLMEMGERHVLLGRSFNAREGFTRKDDTLPGRFSQEETRDKPILGMKVDLSHPGMLDEYYDYRGCDRNGTPTRERLEEVGLHEIAEDLAALGKLSEKRQAISFRRAIRV